MRFSLFKRFAAVFFVLAFQAICADFSIYAQPPAKEVEVPVIQKFGGRSFRCMALVGAGGVIDEENFNRISSDKNCSNLEKLLNVNFETETLISFTVRGDCHVRAAARVTRNDEAKKYTVRIKKIRGGCRAAGAYQSWIMIEKIRSGYTVDFMQTDADKMKDADEIDFFQLASKPAPPKPEFLETRGIELKNCIQLYRHTQFVIRDNDAFLKALRGDMSRPRCLKNLEKIDFDKYTLLGIEVSSSYCGIPDGLEHQVIRDAPKKKYLLNITYADPLGATCRALIPYDLWILVPKLPADYEVKFQVAAVTQIEELNKTYLPKINLAEIGRIAPKGRVQDKDYNRLPVVKRLLGLGKQSIPFLIDRLDDETKIEGRVADYWSEVRVGDMALIILTDFFLDKTGEASAIEGFKWDEFLQRGNNMEITAEQVLRNYIKNNGRKKIKQRWQEIWNKYQARIYWDEDERAFRIAG